MSFMKRTFALKATYDQAQNHDFEITVAQASALSQHHEPKVTLAEIIRANWADIYSALQAYHCPGFEHSSLWRDGERIAKVSDVQGGDNLDFTATEDGPRFSHEIEPTGRAIKSR